MTRSLSWIIILSLSLTACARGAPPAPTATGPLITYRDSLLPMQMRERRAAHTATLLLEGRVLLAGGFQEDGRGREIAIASAELYDPQLQTFTPARPMNEPRDGHTATLLPDGRVLIVGGWGISSRSTTAEMYVPAAGEFVYVKSLPAPRAGHTATLLADGRVLIVGGTSARTVFEPEALVYDPASDQFASAGHLHEVRAGHTATPLTDGSVLIVGGMGEAERVLTSAELYDPTSGQFTRVGNLSAARHKHAAVRLDDGRVLIIGGSDERDWRGQYATTEIYDPQTRTFTPGPRLNGERFKLAEAVVLLGDGRVLVGGGHAALETFDPQAAVFQPGGLLDTAYYFATLTRLNDGHVLIAGGYNDEIEATANVWLYR